MAYEDPVLDVPLSVSQCCTLGKLIDSFSGMENARVLLPIYDAIKETVERHKAGRTEPPNENA